MDNKTEFLEISDEIEKKLKKMANYILMPIDDRKLMVDSMTKIVTKISLR